MFGSNIALACLGQDALRKLLPFNEDIEAAIAETEGSWVCNQPGGEDPTQILRVHGWHARIVCYILLPSFTHRHGWQRQGAVWIVLVGFDDRSDRFQRWQRHRMSQTCSKHVPTSFPQACLGSLFRNLCRWIANLWFQSASQSVSQALFNTAVH